MKKNAPLKWITVVILVIATISLVFGSFIMLFGKSNDQVQTESTSAIATTSQE